MMLRHILVATDFSPATAGVLPMVASIAQRCGAQVTLLHVDELMLLDVFGAEAAGYAELVAAWRKEAMVRDKAPFARLDVPVSTVLRHGAPWRVTIDYALEHEADLIVLAKRGTSELSPFLLGSTTRRLVRHAPVPLLVAPTKPLPREFALRRMVVATDFSRHSEVATRWALKLRELLDLQAELVHVLVSPAIAPVLPGDGALAFPETLKQRLEREARQQLEGVLAAHAADSVSGSLFWDSDVAQGLVASDRGNELFVVAATGKGAIEATLLGSTSERLLRLTDAPVLIVPRAMTNEKQGRS